MTADPLDDFVARRTTEHTLADGTRVRLRPIVPADKQKLLDGFNRMSAESRYRRFMGPIDQLTAEQLRYLTEIDYENHYAIGAVLPDEPDEPGVGVARSVRLPDDPACAEAAVAVVDEYQGRGLGTLLLDALGAAALEHGITRFRAYFLPENTQIKELLESTGARFSVEGGEPLAEIDLPQRAEELKGTALYRVLRLAARGEIGGWRSTLLSWLGRYLPS